MDDQGQRKRGTVSPLVEFPAGVVENDSSVIFTLDEDLQLTYCNPAWDRFAVKNGAAWLRMPAPIGRSVLDAISGPLRSYYESVYKKALGTRQPWGHLYECSSATFSRKFFLQVLPLRASRGLLVINSMRIEHPWEIAPAAALDEIYRDKDRLIVMCSHCRRTRRQEGAAEFWDWVADYVAHPPSAVSHGLCQPCLEYYYTIR